MERSRYIQIKMASSNDSPARTYADNECQYSGGRDHDCSRAGRVYSTTPLITTCFDGDAWWVDRIETASALDQQCQREDGACWMEGKVHKSKDRHPWWVSHFKSILGKSYRENQSPFQGKLTCWSLNAIRNRHLTFTAIGLD